MTMALQIAPSAARVEEGERLWAPPEALAADAAVERFRYWVNARLGLDLADYDALWHWSIDLPGVYAPAVVLIAMTMRSEEHTSELQSLMRIPYAVFCLKKKKDNRYHL